MRPIRNVWTLILRELYSYFCSPIAYVFLIIFLTMMGIFTFGDNLGNLFGRGVADLSIPFFTWHPWLFMMFVPAVGMRLWSEELNRGTLELLTTMPLQLWQAVIAKYVAGISFLALALLLTFPVVLSVNYLGEPDNGKILCGYLGSFLMAASFLAISSITSSATHNQIISFILSLVIILLAILCGFPPIVNMLRQWMPELLTQIVSSLSIYSRFDNMQRGVIDTRDLCYFGSIITLGLTASLNLLRRR